MKIKELTVTAVIPTAQYANLQPSIVVEVEDNEDYEKAKTEAMRHIAQFSKQYAENGKAISGGGSTVKTKTMTPYIGEKEIQFDPAAHAYVDEDGNVYESGSHYAAKFEHEFNAGQIAPLYANKHGLDAQDVLDFWKAKADASTTFGTSLHQALETYGKYKKLADKLSSEEKPVTIGLHPTLEPIVESFFSKARLEETAVYEPFVVDPKNKRCGQIDRLVIVDEKKKIVDIEDYKTNADLYKQGSPKTLKEPFKHLSNQPASKYAIQLSFYAAILEANGWTVRHLKLHHWAGKEWVTTIIDKQEIK